MPGTSPTSTTNPSGDDDQADDQLPMPMMEDGAYDDEMEDGEIDEDGAA